MRLVGYLKKTVSRVATQKFVVLVVTAFNGKTYLFLLMLTLLRKMPE